MYLQEPLHRWKEYNVHPLYHRVQICVLSSDCTHLADSLSKSPRMQAPCAIGNAGTFCIKTCKHSQLLKLMVVVAS